MAEALALRAVSLCCPESGSLRVQFTGGEPLRNLETMEAVYAYGRTGRRLRLKKDHNIHVDSAEEALGRIAAAGHTRVVVQPALLIPGEEYDRLCAWVQAAGELRVSIGCPLLCGDGGLERMAHILREAYLTDEDTVLLVMGHGTEHGANQRYERMAGYSVPVPARLCAFVRWRAPRLLPTRWRSSPPCPSGGRCWRRCSW